LNKLIYSTLLVNFSLAHSTTFVTSLVEKDKSNPYMGVLKTTN